MNILWVAIFVTCSCPAFSNTAQALIARIEAAGTNENDRYRHSVDVTGCAMTTYRWKNDAQHGWLLWSSFQFAMADASFTSASQASGKDFVDIDNDDDTKDFILIFFKLRDGTHARFERHVLRKTEKPKQPSPRNDGRTHYYIQSAEFMITQEGPNVIEKARIFTESYKEYVRDHCNFVG